MSTRMEQNAGPRTPEMGETSAAPSQRHGSIMHNCGFNSSNKSSLYVSWEEFRESLYTRYGPNQFMDYFGELTKLQ
ncbi:hypothetical protein ACOSQ3_015472 [Xanthoceras sorbifolium]